MLKRQCDDQHSLNYFTAKLQHGDCRAKILPVEYWLQAVDHEAAGPLQKFENEHF